MFVEALAHECALKFYQRMNILTLFANGIHLMGRWYVAGTLGNSVFAEVKSGKSLTPERLIKSGCAAG